MHILTLSKKEGLHLLLLQGGMALSSVLFSGVLALLTGRLCLF